MSRRQQSKLMQPFIFIPLIIALGCAPKKEAVNKDVEQLRQIAVFETPATFNSARMVKLRSVELQGNALVDSLSRENVFSLLGKVYENEKNVTILGYVAEEIGKPQIVTFDNSGKQLSRHTLYETAFVDMGEYVYNVVQLLPDRQILFTDSTVVRKLNPDGAGEIPGTDSVTAVNHKKYRLTEEGVVVVVE